MDFYEVIAKRRTVRHFKPDPVPEDAVRRALEAGLKAPCNAHMKSWRYILLKDRQGRLRALADGLKARDMKDPAEVERFVARFSDEELRSVYRLSLPVQLTMMLEAPEVLVVCYKMKPAADCRTLFELNPLASVWMSIENIMLALAAEGFFGCMYTPYDAQGLKDALGIPPDHQVAAVIPFGVPAEAPEARPPESLETRLHIDRWGSAGR